MVKRVIDHQPDNAEYLKYIYVVAIILWIILVIYIHVRWRKPLDWIGLFILFIPIIVYITGIINAKLIKEETAMQLFDANFLTISLLIVIPLLTWVGGQCSSEDKMYFVQLNLLAMVLILLATIDLWVPDRWLSINKHIKSIMNTAAIILIVYSLYSFYLTMPHGLFSTRVKVPIVNNSDHSGR